MSDHIADSEDQRTSVGENQMETQPDHTRLPLEDVSQHPVHREIYGEPEPGLIASLVAEGQHEPIVVTPDHQYVDGGRRVASLQVVDAERIDAEVHTFNSETEVRQFVLAANKYRDEKTVAEKKGEIDARKSLYDDGVYTKPQLKEVLRDAGREVPEKDEPIALCAAFEGWSPGTYHAAARVLEDGRRKEEILEAARAGEIHPEGQDRVIQVLNAQRDLLESSGGAAWTADKRVKAAIEIGKLEGKILCSANDGHLSDKHKENLQILARENIAQISAGQIDPQKAQDQVEEAYENALQEHAEEERREGLSDEQRRQEDYRAQRKQTNVALESAQDELESERKYEDLIDDDRARSLYDSVGEIVEAATRLLKGTRFDPTPESQQEAA